MEECRRELEEEEYARKMKKEKAQKLEKGWELMKICKTYIEKNSKEWKAAAKKKGRLRENEMQTRIPETWRILSKEAQTEFRQNQEDMRRKEMRNIKENLWKKWKTNREKERKREKDESEKERSKTLERKLKKLEEIKQRLKNEEERIEDLHNRNKMRKRKWKKEKEAEDAKILEREALAFFLHISHYEPNLLTVIINKDDIQHHAVLL